MIDPLLSGLLFLLIGLVLGYVLGLWRGRMRVGEQLLPKQQIDTLYVPRAVFESLREQADVLQANLHEKTDIERDLSAALAAEKTRLEHLQLQLKEHINQVAQLQQQNQVAFENMANRLLEDKGKKFALQNQEQLQEILSPLREKIKTFEDNIERRYMEETRDRVSLKKEIEQLRELNQQLSLDASNLTSALKGDNKIQGDWGELQLEMLLEKAGLQKEVHYTTQATFRDEDGQLKRPDLIIHLPGDKHLIIDSKVSLAAYDRFCSASDEKERQAALKNHIESLRAHIKGLAGKKYQQLYQIHTPDYLLLFIPIEPAFALATQADNRLFLEALEQNIVLVTNSTLLATMRTVSYLWKQEKQQHSVLEIARESGRLYDKFVAFVEDLRLVGQRLDSAHTAYEDAMYKLSDGKRYSQTLVGRAEKLRKLGARTSKELPSSVKREEE
ncbi:MAG: DNA recombination protein RmuC [Saprospiraceae bacterium]